MVLTWGMTGATAAAVPLLKLRSLAFQRFQILHEPGGN